MEPRRPTDYTVDALSPDEIARKVTQLGASKVQTGAVSTLALAILAGFFIGLGGILAGTIASGSELGAGPTKMLMGLGLTMGLFMVVITGAELFTGNSLMLMGLVSRHISLRELSSNWSLVYVGNLIGALIVVFLVYFSRWWAQDDYAFAQTAIAIAQGKVDLSFEIIFVRGILANVLVCLAIWLAMAGRTLTDKLLGIALPVCTFIAAGFEHSIANMYFVPLGVLLAHDPEALAGAGFTAEQAARMTLPWTVHNIVAATLGNIIGGGVIVGLAHWFVHLRDQSPDPDE